MKRLDLIRQIKARKDQLNITIENLAKLTGLGVRTVNRVLANEDVKLSTIESITNLLGLDFAGNEVVSLEELKKERAKQKAIFMASLVQSTLALEMQGLDRENVNSIISMYEKEFLYGEYSDTLWVAQMINSTKPIDDATPLDDVSGLKLLKDRRYSLKDIYVYEANNIALATLKYLSAAPSKALAPFSYDWMQQLHYDMFGNVWDWAGKFRQVELSIGIKAYLVPTTLKELVDDISYWDKYKTFDIYEIATRIHHRAVQIHPFLNGNGRWSRMLANIYLRQNGSMPVKWQEDLLSSENPKRDEYIQALKMADNGDYKALIKMHKVTY